MIDEKRLDLEDWGNERLGSGMSEDYKKGFNDSLFLVRSQVRDAKQKESEVNHG